ncbi:hypothetical protein MSAN_02337900 [Mycena sanguinolenta]|uniref:Uncharacterized protein n=1 Tax=Mycena sanguinolenta TaxID=230812 RepID=A0A8H6X6Y5_9AGAR|nr:hypothetical protein MSAN_02337900 [Mycena sanguinolenta]
MSPDTYYDDDGEGDDVCPDYFAATSIRRSNTVTTTSSGATSSSLGSGSFSGRSVHWNSPFDASRTLPPLPPFTSHTQLRRVVTSPASPPPSLRPTTPLRLGPQRYLYTYTMLAAGAPLTFLLSVEPANGKPTPGKYTIRLSLKADDVERPIGEPVSLRLSVDPRNLEFAVFLFPGKNNVLPVGCLYSLRVWLRVNGVDHRIFGEDELWVGADPDFGAVDNASFACLRPASVADSDAQVYDAIVGRARVQFVIRWHPLGDRHYRYTMDYVAGGVGTVLMDDLRLRVEGDPRQVAFLVYTVPVRSIPTGASHRVRLWLKTRADPPTPVSPSAQARAVESYVYQRVWKSDAFKIGARLDFEAIGPRLVMGSPAGPPQTIVMDVLSPVGYQRDAKSPIV